MKLLVITAILEFEKEIKAVLKSANVNAYSYQEVVGFQNNSREAMQTNWFGSEVGENPSILVYAFVLERHADKVFEAFTLFNQEQETASRIHIAVINIEKSNYYEK